MTAGDQADRGNQTERGAAATQLVLIAPVVLLLALVSLQAALAWHAKHIAQTAASQGLAAVRAHHATRIEGDRAAQAALEGTAGRVLRTPTVEVTRTQTTAAVEVHGTVLALIPGLELAVRGHAAGPVERLTGPAGG
jgi:Flp pilus assembly protein TadG